MAKLAPKRRCLGDLQWSKEGDQMKYHIRQDDELDLQTVLAKAPLVTKDAHPYVEYDNAEPATLSSLVQAERSTSS